MVLVMAGRNVCVAIIDGIIIIKRAIVIIAKLALLAQIIYK